jgi:hypothetical protein
MSNGNYLKKGGTKIMLKEGQHMDLSGKIVLISSLNDQAKKLDGNRKMPVIDTVRNKRNPK